MMDIIDHSGDGKLDFPEFAILMAEKIKDEHYEGELEEAYIHLVKKITNNITKSSMRRTYK
jgi:Ca2+-binding EF-hand superfamily protein